MLILGAGRVSRPIVRYFLDLPEVRLTVASLYHEEADALVQGHPRGEGRGVDVSDESAVEPLICEADLVISLVPFPLHPQIARAAIRHRVHMITASYVSPEMTALDAEARGADVLILNEVGLDPGIDHMSAMRMIDRARSEGGSIRGFQSYTGGLPAPEAADNPWSYKFSWSPRGALLAARNPARFLEGGSVRHVPGSDLFECGRPIDLADLGRFEVYPNRDSLRYVDLYGVHDVRDMLRGTLRYPGWCETMLAVSRLGLLGLDVRDWPDGTTYADFLGSFLGDSPSDANETLRKRLARRLGLDPSHAVLERFAWVGLLSDRPITTRRASPLDILTELFQGRMSYRDGERDMVVMWHELEASWPDRPSERRVSLLAAYGEPGGDSATSRTVSLPAASAGRLVLEGRVPHRGVAIPVHRDLYEPILDELGRLGIALREWSEPSPTRPPA